MRARAQGGAKWYTLGDIDPLTMRALMLRLWKRATGNERACT